MTVTNLLLSMSVCSILALGYWALIIQKGCRRRQAGQTAVLGVLGHRLRLGILHRLRYVPLRIQGIPAALDGLHAIGYECVHPWSDQHNIPRLRASSTVETSGV